MIAETAAPVPCTVKFDTQTACTVHPNTMDIEVYEGGRAVDKLRVYSVGGGTVAFEGESRPLYPSVYALHTYKDIAEYCYANNLRLWQYVEQCEGAEIFEYLGEVLYRMNQTIH